jgi:hypothetical protein
MTRREREKTGGFQSIYCMGEVGRNLFAGEIAKNGHFFHCKKPEGKALRISQIIKPRPDYCTFLS